MMNKLLLSAGGAIAVVVFSATMSAAVTLVAGTTCSLSDLTVSNDCEGAYGGNATPDIPGETFFGHDDWTQFAKVNSDSGSSGVLNVTGGGTSGGWSLSGFGGYETIMIALKGGPTFSVYLLGDAATAATSGTWNTNGLLKGNGNAGPGLSNFTVWGRGGDVTPPSPVPLPAAGWMLLAGVGGLAAIRRRKKAA